MNRVWPPALGEWATGDPELLQEAVLRALDAHPDWWGYVLGDVEKLRAEASLPVEAIARQSAATVDTVRRVLDAAAADADVRNDAERRIMVAIFVRCIAKDPFGWLKKFPE